MAHARADNEATSDKDKNNSPKKDAPQLAPPSNRHTEASVHRTVGIERVVRRVSPSHA